MTHNKDTTTRNGSNVSTKLSVVIVNYNGGQLVLDCLESLFENPPQAAYEVIIVDNKDFCYCHFLTLLCVSFYLLMHYFVSFMH